MKPTYRPEIDGLRAIAVVAVIFYHAQIVVLGNNFFQGGFIGVDIFFVISGYLITLLILKEIKLTKKFSFTYFYERRVRRILPVLFVVMLASLPLAWFYLMATSFSDFSKSILYSLGFSSNFYFWQSGLEYGGDESFLKPFLHSWSLSVEEQFYIIFPIFLVISFKYLKNYLIHILILIFITSLLFANWSAYYFSFANFYFLPTRVWELILGSILAYLEIFVKKRPLNKLQNNIFPFLGLLLITHSILFFNDKMFHPSIYTLSPIIGVSLIIWYSGKNDIITKLLSSKLFVGVGLISYSLYLWHYPIFAFVRYSSLITGYDLYKKIFLGFVIVILSIFSYIFIEKPFRNKSKINKRNLVKILLVGLIIIITANSTIIINNGFPKRFFQTEKFSLDNNFYRLEKENYNELVPTFSNYNNKNVLIIGNSHAIDTFNIFHDKFKNDNSIKISLLTSQVQCLKNILEEKLCKKNISLNDKNKINNSNIIILSTLWKNEDLDNLEKIILNLLKKEKKIIIMSQSPLFKWKNIFTTLDLFVIKNQKLPDNDDLNYLEKEMFLEINTKVFDNNKKLKILSNKYNINYFDKLNYTCNVSSKKCFVLTEEKHKIFYDNSHYTISGSKYFQKKISHLGWFESLKKMTQN